MNFAKTFIAKAGMIKDLQRIDEYEIPLVAIREAIANAIVHRDYSITGADIKFAIYDDRIEIISPGCLPRTLSIADIRLGRSEIRNKVIARVFKEMNFIEEWGTGVKRIISVCKNAGLIEPEFVEAGMYFKVTLFKEKIVADSSGIVADSSGIVADNSIRLSEKEKMVIEYLKRNPYIANLKAIEITGLSPAGVRKIFISLKARELIVSDGEGRNRRYKLKNFQ